MWQKATLLRTEQAADDMLSLVVKPVEWRAHKAGQHYEMRIPGSEISRSYSIVSSPSRTGEIEFGVQFIKNGVLSPRVWEMKEGDELEIQGPWGESFVWEPAMGGPLVLIGAGSGITPLLCIHAAYKEAKPEGECYFVMSAKNEQKIMFYESMHDSLITRFTEREKRIDMSFLESAVGKACGMTTLCYVCGPDGFIDSVVDDLLDLGFPSFGIRSERFI